MNKTGEKSSAKKYSDKANGVCCAARKLFVANIQEPPDQSKSLDRQSSVICTFSEKYT